MSKWLEFFGIKKETDERVQQQGTKVFFEAGIFVFCIAILDIIVRGMVLDRPLAEWGFSFFIIGAYLVYGIIRMAFAGVYDQDIYDETSFKKKMRKHTLEHLLISLFLSIITTVHDGMPHDLMGWMEIPVKFCCAFLAMQLVEWVLSRISLRKIKKELQ